MVLSGDVNQQDQHILENVRGQLNYEKGLTIVMNSHSMV